ncbi:hypothetical protein [Sporosarcina limicola]|uniref:dTDP-4-amino-4,6-dideoxygalactose transaminase n=1 Tax=Sporosarcina limicola TaxID=34101 RepID=A0A927MLN0_9BACL|nr:hypothetical protein [Sporosarcina limicola]MBE1555397.1 dTDP-4-amino-4,6-dideoxygalactose transaminase [Sporosarcina limicola]
MRALTIGVHVHYIPVYWQRDLGYEKGLCPVAENWYEQALTWSVYLGMMKSR